MSRPLPGFAMAKRRGPKARATDDDVDIDTVIAEELHGGVRRISWRKAAKQLFWVMVSVAGALVVGAEVHAQVGFVRPLPSAKTTANITAKLQLCRLRSSVGWRCFGEPRLS